MTAAAVAEQEDRTDWHLRNWAAWLGRGGLNIWYPSRASGRMGQSGSSDFDSMCANVDAHCAQAVDTIIDDLPQRERQELYNAWMATVFRYRGHDEPVVREALYKSAVTRLSKGMRARGMW